MKLSRSLCGAVTAGIVVFAQAPLTLQEQRGRQIYERGATASGRAITAEMGEGNSGIPGSILPCVNCHGHDGRGKPESGTVPSDITWEALTKPYGVTHANGRRHPPYAERLLKRAITLGVDPAGNSLDSAMPRFQLYNDDFSDLVSFLKTLGQGHDPGISETTVRLGVILPPAGSGNQLVRAALLGYFARLNGTGGIFGRRIELSFMDAAHNAKETASRLRGFIEKEGIFALVGGYVMEAEPEIAAVLEETGTPSVAAFTAGLAKASPPGRYAFFLDGGVEAEVNALASFATRELPDKASPIAIASDEDSTTTARRLKVELQNLGYRNLVARASEAAIVFWLRSGSALNETPFDRSARIYAPAMNGVPLEDLPLWRIKAIAAAEVITEAARRAGHALTRESLIESLEGIYRFETSAGPVSFGPNRRTGETTVEVLRLDAQGNRSARSAR